MTAMDIRALTIRWPWVAAIAFPAPEGCEPKRVENRTRRTGYCGPLLIHAGLAWDSRHTTGVVMRAWVNAGGLDHIPFDLCQGSILAVAHLVDCHPADGSCCLPWGRSDAGAWHWVLDGVQRLSEPVAARGQLGLWRPSVEVAERVLAQIGVSA